MNIKDNNKLDAEQVAALDRYLAKYKSGALKAPAIVQLLRTAVSTDTMKASIEVLVPGYTRSWAPSPYEHPIIV